MCNYEIIKGEFYENSNCNDSKNNFYISDLVAGINSKAFSVYKFYHLKYQTPMISFLIIDNENVEIFDLLSFDVLIEKILNSNIRENDKGVIIKEVLKFLRLYYEECNMKMLVFEQDFGKYHYFIPLMNLKK